MLNVNQMIRNWLVASSRIKLVPPPPMLSSIHQLTSEPCCISPRLKIYLLVRWNPLPGHHLDCHHQSQQSSPLWDVILSYTKLCLSHETVAFSQAE